jgi:hypothetical protein
VRAQGYVTDDDATMMAKIARAHLNEFPDYYARLAKMVAEADADRAVPRRVLDATAERRPVDLRLPAA